MTDLPVLPPDLVVGILGGTGPQGLGLGRRFAGAGISVVLGSRDPARAVDAAAGLAAEGLPVRGESNAQAAGAGAVVVVAVPYPGHLELLQGLAETLSGRIVIDCVNPLGFDDRGPYPLDVAAGSAAAEAAEALPGARVVAAFHHVSAVLLCDPSLAEVDTDVLVCSDDRAAAELVTALACTVPGMRGVYAGRLRLAGAVEMLTANLIAVNRRYRAHAGVRLTGLGEAAGRGPAREGQEVERG